MKKYWTGYLFIWIGYCLLFLTHGIPYTVELDRYFEASQNGETVTELLPWNIPIILILFLLSVLMTISKKNTIKYKWLIAIVSFGLAVVMPIGKVNEIGFHAGFLEALLGRDYIYFGVINLNWLGLTP